MVKKHIICLLDKIDEQLKIFCGNLSEEKRFILLLSMILLLTVGSFWFTIGSIYRIGKKQGERKRERTEMREMLNDTIMNLQPYGTDRK